MGRGELGRNRNKDPGTWQPDSDTERLRSLQCGFEQRRVLKSTVISYQDVEYIPTLHDMTITLYIDCIIYCTHHAICTYHTHTYFTSHTYLTYMTYIPYISYIPCRHTNHIDTQIHTHRRSSHIHMSNTYTSTYV
jgi:hypothetical protein